MTRNGAALELADARRAGLMNIGDAAMASVRRRRCSALRNAGLLKRARRSLAATVSTTTPTSTRCGSSAGPAISGLVADVNRLLGLGRDRRRASAEVRRSRRHTSATSIGGSPDAGPAAHAPAPGATLSWRSAAGVPDSRRPLGYPRPVRDPWGDERQAPRCHPARRPAATLPRARTRRTPAAPRSSGLRDAVDPAAAVAATTTEAPRTTSARCRACAIQSRAGHVRRRSPEDAGSRWSPHRIHLSDASRGPQGPPGAHARNAAWRSSRASPPPMRRTRARGHDGSGSACACVDRADSRIHGVGTAADGSARQAYWRPGADLDRAGADYSDRGMGSTAVLRRGWASLVNRSLNMFTLIALGVGAAFGYSVIATIAPDIFPHSFRMGDAVAVYFEPAAVIVVLVLLGQVLELRARGRTGAAIRNLLSLPSADRAAHRRDCREDICRSSRSWSATGWRAARRASAGRRRGARGHAAIDESMVTVRADSGRERVGARNHRRHRERHRRAGDAGRARRRRHAARANRTHGQRGAAVARADSTARRPRLEHLRPAVIATRSRHSWVGGHRSGAAFRLCARQRRRRSDHSPARAPSARHAESILVGTGRARRIRRADPQRPGARGLRAGDDDRGGQDGNLDRKEAGLAGVEPQPGFDEAEVLSLRRASNRS